MSRRIYYTPKGDVETDPVCISNQDSQIWWKWFLRAILIVCGLIWWRMAETLPDIARENAATGQRYVFASEEPVTEQIRNPGSSPHSSSTSGAVIIGALIVVVFLQVAPITYRRYGVRKWHAMLFAIVAACLIVLFLEGGLVQLLGDPQSGNINSGGTDDFWKMLGVK